MPLTWALSTVSVDKPVSILLDAAGPSQVDGVQGAFAQNCSSEQRFDAVNYCASRTIPAPM
jgi:hypothetical protein